MSILPAVDSLLGINRPAHGDPTGDRTPEQSADPANPKLRPVGGPDAVANTQASKPVVGWNAPYTPPAEGPDGTPTLDAQKKATADLYRRNAQKRIRRLILSVEKANAIATAQRERDHNLWEVVTLSTPGKYTMRTHSRPYNAFLVGDSVTQAVTVQIPGLTAYTRTLTPGWNVVNYPEGTTLVLPAGAANVDVGILYSMTPLPLPESFINAPLPAGSNLIGTVELADAAGVNKLAVDAGGKIGLNNYPANVDAGVMINAVASTTNQNTSDQSNFNSRGIKVFVNMTNAGTGSITVSIQGKDTGSGLYYTILAGAAIIANGTQLLTVYPGITATANVSASDFLPKTWRILVTANNANATTYTVSAEVEI